MKKRTTLNFSEHELKITQTEDVTIHELAKPNTRTQSVTFINCRGVLTVTGDYGNWVFCREFMPNPKWIDEAGVSDSYWVEKATIFSVQKVEKFDSKATEEYIDEYIKNAEDYGFDENDLQYLRDCRENTHMDEFEYQTYIREHMPRNWDCEYIPFATAMDASLKYVFDAFEEICLRLHKEAQDVLKK